MKKETKVLIEKRLQDEFRRILIEPGTEKAIEKRLKELTNVWFQLTVPSIDILESVCRPIKIKMGNVFPKIAQIIAKEVFDEAEVDKSIEGFIGENTILEIDRIISEYAGGEDFPDYERDKARILEAQRIATEKVKREESIDLYLKKGNSCIYFEMKSGGKHDTTAAPAIKRRSLMRLALANSPLVDCKVGLSYNPFGEEAEYGWSQMTSLFELHKELLIGKEFWNFIGQSPKTYEELKEIFAKIGPPMECEAIDAINKILSAAPYNPNQVRLTYTKYNAIFEP